MRKKILRQIHKYFATVALVLAWVGGAFAQTTAFTYQGRLTDGATPANGTYDLQFKLFDTPTVETGTQQGLTITNPGVQVTAGIFTVTLDFSANVFTGAARYLEIGVRPAGSSNSYTVLSPRQPITSTPYAIQTLNAQRLGGISASEYLTNTNLGNSVIRNQTTLQANSNLNISGNGFFGGNVGIGTTSPSQMLHVSGQDARLRLDSLNASTWTTTEYKTDTREWHTGVGGSNVPNDVKGKYYIFDATAGQFRMMINTSGNVGIGTTEPFYKLHVLASSGNGITGSTSEASRVGVFGIATAQSGIGVGVWGSTLSPTGHAGLFTGRVYVSENLGIGTLEPQRLLHVNGRARIGSIPPEASTGQVCFNAVGDLLQCGSSLRFKTNVKPFVSGLDLVQRLRPISFDWKDGSGNDVGLAAEDVAQAAPSFAVNDQNGRVSGVKYDRLSILLINAIKEQQQQIEKMRTENANVNARLRALEKRLRQRSISGRARR